ncbi:MAG: hypothetical protein ABIY39_03155 [Sphingomonas sp.]
MSVPGLVDDAIIIPTVRPFARLVLAELLAGHRATEAASERPVGKSGILWSRPSVRSSRCSPISS